MNRQNFIRSILGASAFISLPFSTHAKEDNAVLEAIANTKKPTKGNLFGFKASPIEKVKVGIIGLGNRGTTLLQMFSWLHTQSYCEIVALADLHETKVTKATSQLEQWQKRKPKTYFGNKKEWQKLVAQDDIDLLLIATPWELHAKMCIYGMNHGKHVACEVPIAYTLANVGN
ncbi:Gfo/Idh/MocA family protein [Tenacibaculum sp. SG-28]|uniref:Gfo/Idh/MocA family protein n=1 Tax=Tenacibaculum sp. SG-28 TaxID=754426 RepID=UPI000CF56AB2|nr:Gfo/Idh/MocA family oxidoreductase [Tenacibaculum sp. SG-28]